MRFGHWLEGQGPQECASVAKGHTETQSHIKTMQLENSVTSDVFQ